MSYEKIMSEKNEIMKQSVGLDYSLYEQGTLAFDFEKMMKETGYSIEEMKRIQQEYGVGNTPLIELKHITQFVRKMSKPGYGARLFMKDEACNSSGSFKDRRAAISVYHAKQLGYSGVIAATSGNYGAAVASQAAKHGLKCIIVQECYDSNEIGQPEIIEKARKCEAFGAEVIQLTVGPELFYTFLQLLKETGYFNASLYTPFGIAGIETLGYEIANQVRQMTNKEVDVVVCTNAGGGNLTGTVRGLHEAACYPTIVAASVNLKGLHMASDLHFNKKSFTTGHTGFGVPFTTYPDRSDVPRSAARPLRYMDRYVTVQQGSVFYATELLAKLEGLERGPAGNTSLAAALVIAKDLKEDQIVVVQESEYTGAGKHIQPQLDFAKQNGIELLFGNVSDEIPGKNIVFPKHPFNLSVEDIDLNYLRKTLINNLIKNKNIEDLKEIDYLFLSEETRWTIEEVKNYLNNN